MAVAAFGIQVRLGRTQFTNVDWTKMLQLARVIVKKPVLWPQYTLLQNYTIKTFFINGNYSIMLLNEFSCPLYVLKNT